MFPKWKCALGMWLLGKPSEYMETDEMIRNHEVTKVGVRTPLFYYDNDNGCFI